jgi:hypothetical protein
MFKSNSLSGSNPSPSSRRSRSPSNYSQYGESTKRFRQNPTSPSKSDDDGHEEQRNKDDKKKSEVRSKKSSKSFRGQITSDTSSGILGPYRLPAELPPLQV